MKEDLFDVNTWELSFGELFAIFEVHGQAQDTQEDYDRLNDLLELVKVDVTTVAKEAALKSDSADVQVAIKLWYGAAEEWLISHGHLKVEEKKFE